MLNKKILVTGGAGVLGSHLCAQGQTDNAQGLLDKQGYKSHQPPHTAGRLHRVA